MLLSFITQYVSAFGSDFGFSPPLERPCARIRVLSLQAKLEIYVGLFD